LHDVRHSVTAAAAETAAAAAAAAAAQFHLSALTTPARWLADHTLARRRKPIAQIDCLVGRAGCEPLL